MKTRDHEKEVLMESLNELTDLYFKKMNKLEQADIDRITQIVSTISSYLPEVSKSSLFEIDDLLYEINIVKSTQTASGYFAGASSFVEVASSCFEEYIDIYEEFKYLSNQNMDMLFLQLIEFSSVDVLRENNRLIFSVITDLIAFKDVVTFCRGLKVLQKVLEKDPKLIEDMTNNPSDMGLAHIYDLVMKLENIPNFQHPNRIVSWLSERSANIVKYLKPFALPKAQFLLEKLGFNGFIIYIWKIATFTLPLKYKTSNLSCYCSGFPSGVMAICDLLYKFLTSETDEQRKSDRVKLFLNCSGFVSLVQHMGYSTKCFINLTKYTVTCFKIHFELLQKKYTEKQIAKISETFGYDFKPHFPEINKSSKLEEIEELERSVESESEELALEDFIFYSDFMKLIKLMDILNSICPIEIKKSEFEIMHKIDDGDYFRIPYFTKFFKNVLKSPQKMYSHVWHSVMERCPYLFLRRRHSYLNDELKNLMLGEVDEATLEELYFAEFYQGEDNVDDDG